MARTLYSKLLTVIEANPELRRYRGMLKGGCCRHPEDDQLRKRIQAFILKMPHFSPALRPLVDDVPAA